LTSCPILPREGVSVSSTNRKKGGRGAQKRPPPLLPSPRGGVFLFLNKTREKRGKTSEAKEKEGMSRALSTLSGSREFSNWKGKKGRKKGECNFLKERVAPFIQSEGKKGKKSGIGKEKGTAGPSSTSMRKIGWEPGKKKGGKTGGPRKKEKARSLF